MREQRQHLAVLLPQALLFLHHLHIGEVAHQRQDLVDQQVAAVGAVVAEVVAIAGLGHVDVPVPGRVARADDLVQQHQRTADHRAAAFLGVEELVLADLGRLRVVADEDDVDLLVVPRQEQVQQDEEALGQVLAVLVHGAGHIHHAEHHGLADGRRHARAVAKPQVDGVEKGHRAHAQLQRIDALLQLGRRLAGAIVLRQQRLQLLFQCLEFAVRRLGQRNAPAQGAAHGAQQGQVVRRAVVAVAGAARLVLHGVADVGAQQARQGQVFKEQFHELFLGQGEGEVVLALAAVAGLGAAAACAALRPGNAVAAHMLGVARVHRVMDAALPMVEHGLADVLARDGDALGLLHVADAALVHRAAHRLGDLRLVAAHEALAVAHRLVLAGQPAIDDLQCHLFPPARARRRAAHPPVSCSCERADTTRTAGAPAWTYSPWPPCG